MNDGGLPSVRPPGESVASRNLQFAMEGRAELRIATGLLSGIRARGTSASCFPICEGPSVSQAADMFTATQSDQGVTRLSKRLGLRFLFDCSDTEAFSRRKRPLSKRG